MTMEEDLAEQERVLRERLAKLDLAEQHDDHQPALVWGIFILAAIVAAVVFTIFYFAGEFQ